MLDYKQKYMNLEVILNDINSEDKYYYQVLFSYSKKNRNMIKELGELIFVNDGYYFVNGLNEFTQKCHIFEKMCNDKNIEIVHYNPTYFICTPDNDIIMGGYYEDIYRVVA